MSTDLSDDDFFSAGSNDDSFLSVPSLSETLTAQFSDVSKSFNVVHINAQSIPAHFPDMLANFDCTNIHAILVSETWLKPSLASTCYSLPGFQLIRNDRTYSGGGGVAIYLRAHIPFTIVSTSSLTSPANAGEHLFIEVILHHTKVLLGVYYSPSLRIDYFSSLELILENLVPSYSHTIIMGDFNTCLLKNDSRSTSLRSMAESINLSILPLNSTHNLPNCNPSLLDLIFVSSLQHVIKHGQIPADCFSYHDLIFLSYKIRTPKSTPKILWQRNFRSIDVEHLRDDALKIDWQPLFNAESIDEKTDLFARNLIELYDRHAPVRAIKVKHLPSPWLTEEIKMIMVKKSAAQSQYKRRPSQHNWEKFVAIRNRCNKMCRNAQRRHIHSSVLNGDPVKVWKFLKSLGVGKINNNSIPNDLDVNKLIQHFSSSSKFERTKKAATLNYLSSCSTPDYPPFFFSQFSDCDVKKSIISISSNAVGCDSIGRNMILPILDELLPIICHIMNHSISSGSFPTKWKEAQIFPLPKKKNPSSLSDYRPISILPFLSKVLERLVHDQLNSFLIKSSALNPLQSGFRPGHSTTTVLVHVTDDIRLGMEEGKLTVLALIDFSNAFNTVDFDIMLSILRTLNISPAVIDWFHSYLFGRKQRICIENTFSSWCNTSAGVPQGGVLSPLLFSVFINSITSQLLSSYHLYADDLQIYAQASLNSLPKAVDAINLDLRRICDWSAAHGLAVNPSKTQAIIVGSSRIIQKINWTQLPMICCQGELIPYSQKVKNLGIYLDSCFSWKSQLEEVSRRMFASAGSLRRLRNFLPVVTKIALAQSLLLPILDYADVSYLDLTENQLNKLERLQNVCIRFIFGLRKYDHISEYRTKLKWLSIRCRRNAHILFLLYNVLFHPNSPPYLKTRFVFLHNTHDKLLRSSENLKLKTPMHSTRFMDKSFSVQAVRLWNALPIQIKQSQSLNIFKNRVKEHYLCHVKEK